jgi:exodeoxyribonuclease V alpha subunit
MSRKLTMTQLPSSAQDAQPTPAFKTLSGVVERITFQNEETGYTVARLLPNRRRGDADDAGAEHAHTGDDHLVTIIGTLLGVVAGEALELSGFWQRHAQHGWQFTVHNYRSILPATTQGLRKYLGSGLIKGIGPKTAEKIVARFGLDTLEILEQQQERLLEVSGLGPERAKRIATAWEEQKAIKEVMVCLQGLGVSTSLAVRIYKEYGDAATTVVKNEPYRLARDVWGIGFKTADKIAQGLGYTHDHPERVKAGIFFALSEASESGGYTYLPRPVLAEQAAELLGVSPEQAEEAISSLQIEGSVLVDALVVQPDGQSQFVPLRPDLDLAADAPSQAIASHASEPETRGIAHTARHVAVSPAPARQQRSAPKPEEQVVYLPPFYAAEQGIARNLLRLAQCAPSQGRLASLQQTNFQAMFDYLATQAQLTLADRQQDGIMLALTHPVSILTGGPGTGKTTSLRALIHVLTLKKKQIVLAAPTGRAAKRLSEATGLAAKTLHRLLQLRPGGKSAYDRANPLPADIVIVDEVSMLDTLLMNTLLKAIATGTHVLLVGDADQLPSVGAGKVLADVIDSGVVTMVQLDQIFRQSAGSSIAENAQRINHGLLPLTGKDHSEFFFFPQEEPEAASDLVIDLVCRRIPTRFGVRTDEIQVLAPMHRGKCGVGELNTRLQTALNPSGDHKPERRYGGICFRVGDKVLQLRNNYEKEVFNGDGGWITAISLEDQRLSVRLDDDRIVLYEFSELDELTLAYAMSIHKAQGSEYPVCVIPVAMEQYMLLERQLVYTAVTRARQLVVLVGSKKALAIAVKNGPKRDVQEGGKAKAGDAQPSREAGPGKHRRERYTGLAIRLRQVRGYTQTGVIS